MEPTLVEGDISLLRKKRKNEFFSHGDIVAFRFDSYRLFGKRVFALPGDSVILGNGKICVANRICLSNPEGDNLPVIEIRVPENTYFVLGDNLNSSYDSRHFENTFVSGDDIEYKYMGKANILNRIGLWHLSTFR